MNLIKYLIISLLLLDKLNKNFISNILLTKLPIQKYLSYKFTENLLY